MSGAKSLLASGMRPEEYPRPVAPAAPARRVSCLDPAQGLRGRDGSALAPMTLDMLATRLGALATLTRSAAPAAVRNGSATQASADARVEMLETAAAMLRSGLTEEALRIEARRVSGGSDDGQLSLF